MQLESNNFWICSWWTRGWTLQELLAPKTVEFYDGDWVRRGTKSELSNEIHEFTSINLNIFLIGAIWELSTIPAAGRMSWAANRSTTRQGDLAYSLLGLFNINMSLLYGKGQKAFIRLQEETIEETNDLTLFVWVKNSSAVPQQQTHGILATSPSDFKDASDILTGDSLKFGNDFAMTNKGRRFILGLSAEGNRKVLILNCCSKDSDHQVDIYLTQYGACLYVRDSLDSLAINLKWDTLLEPNYLPLKEIFVSKRVLIHLRMLTTPTATSSDWETISLGTIYGS